MERWRQAEQRGMEVVRTYESLLAVRSTTGPTCTRPTVSNRSMSS
jgi:hypothetical protein